MNLQKEYHEFNWERNLESFDSLWYAWRTSKCCKTFTNGSSAYVSGMSE